MLLLPIGDDNYGHKKPYVNYALIGLNVFVYFFLTPSMSEKSYETFTNVWALDVANKHLLTFISSMFIHKGFSHIAMNMLFLRVFGDNLERKLGHVGYLAFYLVTGIFASVAFVATTKRRFCRASKRFSGKYFSKVSIYRSVLMSPGFATAK